jgi:hypothetical protein
MEKAIDERLIVVPVARKVRKKRRLGTTSGNAEGPSASGLLMSECVSQGKPGVNAGLSFDCTGQRRDSTNSKLSANVQTPPKLPTYLLFLGRDTRDPTQEAT